MNEYPFDRKIENEVELLHYYLDAINYRNNHKNLSVEVALHVFRRTNSDGMLSFKVSEAVKKIRFEFGALEHPGWSDDESKSLEESEDEAWDYVFDMVKNQIKKDSL